MFYNQNNNGKTGKRIIETESLRQPEPLLHVQEEFPVTAHY